VLDELAKRGLIDARRVAVIGSTFGGYLALRALQLHPGRFVCGVVADVPSDLPAWLNIDQRWRDAATKFRMQTEAWFFGTDQAQLRRQSPLYHPRPIGRPLLVMEDAVRQNIMPRNFDTMVRKLEADGEPIERTAAGELLGRGAGTGNYIAHGAIRVFFARHLGVSEP
jgi:dipeptidyl aminopeptidase/acylaminoacyl peptidase